MKNILNALIIAIMLVVILLQLNNPELITLASTLLWLALVISNLKSMQK